MVTALWLLACAAYLGLVLGIARCMSINDTEDYR